MHPARGVAGLGHILAGRCRQADDHVGHVVEVGEAVADEEDVLGAGGVPRGAVLGVVVGET